MLLEALRAFSNECCITYLFGEGGIGYRPTLSDSSSRQELEDEIEWIRDTLIDILNSNTKVVTICARSKRWWSDEIREKRRTLGRAVRRWKAGKGGEAEDVLGSYDEGRYGGQIQGDDRLDLGPRATRTTLSTTSWEGR